MTRLRTATLATLYAVGIAYACGSEPVTRGPLAQIADTVLGNGLECTEVDHWPVTRSTPPFRDCRATVADTAMTVVSERSDTAVAVMRSWAAGADGEERYSELLAVLQQQYGEGVFVPSQFGEHPDRLMTIWSFDTHHLRLRLMPSERSMYLQWWSGLPEH